ncbi:DUF4173 domain-containing protein [Patescibacteria group bacterium]|nr:DUF4173 domain-containing protein [Patescibacteria group bacterium]MBP9710492.1 DUF4173 domain-containing protein [Patescibacteria group bacterium]
MDSKILNALSVIATSLGLAFVFNFMFFDKLIGISVVVITAILIGAVYLLGLRQQVSLRNAWWLVPLILFFAFMPGVRANEFLTFLNVCATFGLLMLFAHELIGTPTFLMRIYDYFILMTRVPFRMFGKAVSTITLLTQIHGQVKHRDVWLRVLKGVVMAVPVLVVFGILFSQADLAFSQFLTSFVDITITERMVEYVVQWLFAFVATLSFLSYIFFSKRPESNIAETSEATKSVKSIEVMVFLGLIAALFLLFIGFQVTYLFGGEANILNAGFTYAEYARQGFWELLAVAALSLLVLLASEKYAGVEGKKDKPFLVPALILIAEVGVLMVSAFKRLSLYIDAYGMTALRFYAVGFIVFLVALFILLAIKFIVLKRESFFAFGALLSLVVLLITVNLVNPDAFIARANLERYNQTGKIDLPYMSELSADAQSWKIELYKKLEGGDRGYLQMSLERQKARLEIDRADWQSANLARARAWEMLQALGI